MSVPQNKTILAVDDNPTNLSVVTNLLEEYDVIPVTNALEALEIISREKIDLILLDIVMPEIDGYTLCEMLKSKDETKDIPVIFLSANTDKDSVEKGYAIGAVDYITKPFSLKELLSKVKKRLVSSENILLAEVISKSKQLVVLVIENDMEEIEILLPILEKFFDYIDIAIGFDDGLSKYKKISKTYDIVISSANLEKNDELYLAQSILEINKDQIIILTSDIIRPKVLEEMLHIGVSYFLYKPIQFNNFIQILSKALDKLEKTTYEYEKLNEVQKLNHELDALVDSFDRYVIASRTDLKGNITYASKAYETISGYTKKELLGKPHSIVRHPDMPKSAFADMWETIKKGELWVGEVMNLRKDKSFYWVKASIAPYYDKKNNHIGYSAIRLDITAQKEVEELHKSIENLLNNVAQGFLSFDKNYTIDKSYSKECLAIFEKNELLSYPIDELLFGNDIGKQELFCDGISRLYDEADEMIQEIFLSLLPKEHLINNKYISIEYKLLDSNKCMLVLTDITKNKELQKKLNEQTQIQKMIISAVSNKNDFIDINNEFLQFLEHIPKDFRLILRELHTFKGVFAQKNFLYTPEAIHQLETILSQDTNSDFKTTIQNFDLKSYFEKDLKIINSNLPPHFLSSGKTINISLEMIENIEQKLKYFQLNKTDNTIDEVLDELAQLKYESVYRMLQEYQPLVKQLGQKLEKETYPLIIEGDENIVINDIYKPFFKSLIHFFNNSLDHGIEDMETRVELGKEELGTIQCKYTLENGIFRLEISDDGNGIDTNKLVEKAISKNIITPKNALLLDEKKKLFLIFEESLSSKDEVDITSGRGIGMSAIKIIVEELQGEIDIENEIANGVTFKFTFNTNNTNGEKNA